MEKYKISGNVKNEIGHRRKFINNKKESIKDKFLNILFLFHKFIFSLNFSDKSIFIFRFYLIRH